MVVSLDQGKQIDRRGAAVGLEREVALREVAGPAVGLEEAVVPGLEAALERPLAQPERRAGAPEAVEKVDGVEVVDPGVVGLLSVGPESVLALTRERRRCCPPYLILVFPIRVQPVETGERTTNEQVGVVDQRRAARDVGEERTVLGVGEQRQEEGPRRERQVPRRPLSRPLVDVAERPDDEASRDRVRRP